MGTVPAQPVLHITNLAIGYRVPRKPAITVVENINVDLSAGELVCLIGPNGAGKSTLMRTLAGMQAPLMGNVRLMGDDLTTLKPRDLARRVSIVLTDRVDVGVLSAYMLVALGRYPYTGWMGDLRPEDESVVQQAISAVGAEDLADRNVGELSDGERQKIMIARALAQEPAVMLLDEPTAYLDLPRRAELMTMLRRLARETGRAILLSTHDLDLALRNADRIWLLPKGGQLRVGAPEDLVLSGAFEAAFKGEGVQFDAYTGSFRSENRASGVVNLRGSGLPALWTLRALEREGFCVVQGGNESTVSVTVSQQGQASIWTLRVDEVERTTTSLYDLISMLREQGNAAVTNETTHASSSGCA
ncbi:MAG: ATP-binding cassette domain-containing protein [Anaerolineaceae bacterium]|nr:ATP-binding cassette domain-containing protein [Anaerolineaceae bacterium]